MTPAVETNEWAQAEHARAFLERRASIPKLEEAYAELLDILPPYAGFLRALDREAGALELEARLAERVPTAA